MKRRKGNSSIEGFTLIEILVAVAIMGISLVTIIGLQIKTIRLQQISNRTTTATLLAQGKMSETMMDISGTSPSLYFDEGDFEEDEEETYDDYRWEYTLSALPMADDLYRIDLMVYWDPEEKEGNSVTLTSFVMGGP